MGDTTEKFLTFLLANQLYAINLKDIQEIKGSKEKIALTNILNAPPHMRGLLTLHEKIIPVIDLRILYEIEHASSYEFDVLLIVNINERSVAIAVDNVLDIIELSIDDVKPPPDFSSIIERNYINGIGSYQDQLFMILNIEKLLNQHHYQEENHGEK